MELYSVSTDDTNSVEVIDAEFFDETEKTCGSTVTASETVELSSVTDNEILEEEPEPWIYRHRALMPGRLSNSKLGKFYFLLAIGCYVPILDFIGDIAGAGKRFTWNLIIISLRFNKNTSIR